MEFQVRSFVSCVLEDAVDCFVEDTEEAIAIDYFAEDFDDTAEQEQVMVRVAEAATSTPCDEKNPMLQYLCRLLDGALSGKARVFETPRVPDALLASKRFARSRVATQLLCPRKELEKQVLLPLDCLPLSPPMALRGPNVSILLGSSKADLKPYVFAIPRPPSMPRVKQPMRRNIRQFTKVNITQEEDADTLPLRFSKTSAMALDLGQDAENSKLGKVEMTIGTGLLPPIDARGVSGGAAGWHVSDLRLSKAA